MLTFCACNAGTNNIIIPADLELKGTVRFLDAGKGQKMVADFEKTVREICSGRGIGCDFSCPVPYLPVVNRAEDFEKVRSILTESCGKEAFFELPEHTMSSEDFSWYLSRCPGALFRFGTRNEALGCTALAHRADFRIDESGMRAAAEAIVAFVLDDSI